MVPVTNMRYDQDEGEKEKHDHIRYLEVREPSCLMTVPIGAACVACVVSQIAYVIA